MRCNSILDVVGRTPLIRLNRIAQGLKPEMYVKADYLNPGGSVKDRIGIWMINDAERRGLLKPGGTIIEGTSGNTGMGLALVAAVRGYKAVFTITDKQSKEKIDLLKALGAEVIVCPTAVEPDDPRSYYSVARKLAREIPNSYYPNQYENPTNPQAHFETTGPEIWEDTEGRVTHFVAGLGTGGTISGIGRYLKSQNPKVKVIGVDPVGSLYYDYIKKGVVGKAQTYKVEGIGEDIFPSTMDFSVLDDVVRVTDKQCFLWTRKLARLEGIFAGGSSGAAIYGALEVARTLSEKELVVAFLPDTGTRNLSKVYNDEWMRDNQFLEPELSLTLEELVRTKAASSALKQLISVPPHQTVFEALETMQARDISQLPVFENGRPIGAVHEEEVVNLALEGKDLKKLVVREVMGKPFPILRHDTHLGQLTRLLSDSTPAAFVEMADGRLEILTRYDLVQAIARNVGQGGRS